MGRFTAIPQDTFEGLQLDAGVLLKNFDPSNPVAPADEDIICATTGGIKVDCVPTFSDFGEDVDNCPNNMKELKHLDGWNCSLGFTSLGTSVEGIKLALGCADINNSDGTHVIPRRNLSQDDFDTVWWVGDKANGGFVAVRLRNALSTGGFSLQTTKNGKGQTACTLTGHVSINAQDVVPMDFFSSDDDGSGSAASTETFTGNGVDDEFVLAHVPTSVDEVTVDGNAMVATTDYTVSGRTVTFESASIPADGDMVKIRYTYSTT
jgi:hypothetical protein